MEEMLVRAIRILLCCFVTVHIIFDFFDKMHYRVYSRKSIYVFARLAFFAVLSAIVFVNIPLLNLLFSTVLAAIAGYFLYTGDTSEFLNNLLFSFSLVFCEEAAAMASDLLHSYSFLSFLKPDYYRFLMQAFWLILVLFCYRIFIICNKRTHSIKLAKLQYHIFFMFPVFSILMITALSAFSPTSALSLTLSIVSITVIILLNLFIAYLFEFISENYALQNELNLFQQQASFQYSYYNNLEEEYRQVRKVRHDMRNHLQLLEKLYQSGEKQMADQYAKNMYEMIDAMGQNCYSENKVLNIIVNDKIKIAELNQISFECKIGDANLDFIAPIDLTTIFANLLDNAIEGCKKVSNNRFIKIMAGPFHDFININISNSFSEDQRKQGEQYLSTKEAHEGIGIPNVIQTVEKYGGNLVIHTEQNVFKVNVVIPVQKSRG